MSDLLLIRHGRTSWNECGRIQGHRDIGLSAAGRAELAGCRIPPEYAHFRWYASPLARAVETAPLFGARDLQTDARLVELHWGEWQGWTRHGLREHYGEAFAENEARGLGFRPPGGESPGELRLRFREWLAEIAAVEQGVRADQPGRGAGWNLVGFGSFLEGLGDSAPSGVEPGEARSSTQSPR